MVSLIAAIAITAGPATRPVEAATTSVAASQPRHDQVFRLLQMNMCMSGRVAAGPCFNKIDDAAAKRRTIIHEIEKFHPAAVTINEGCSKDLDDVAARLHWQVRYQETADGRPCTEGRGNSVNAILAKDFSSKFVKQGYFKGSDTRSYICSGIDHIVVCTAHLKAGLHKRSVNIRNHQCRQLRRILHTRKHPAVFAKLRRDCFQHSCTFFKRGLPPCFECLIGGL